jgi:hypothetical protein
MHRCEKKNNNKKKKDEGLYSPASELKNKFGTVILHHTKKNSLLVEVFSLELLYKVKENYSWNPLKTITYGTVCSDGT